MRWPGRNRYAVGHSRTAARHSAVGAGQADQAVADVGGPAVGVHIAQPDEDVRVAEAGPEPDLGADLADHVGRPAERRRGVGQHVGAALQVRVVDAPGRPGQPGTAGRGRGVGRVVAVPVGGGLAGRIAAQHAARLEVQPPGREPRRRPAAEVPPGFLAHHEQADRGARRQWLAAGQRQPEPGGLGHRHPEHARGGVRPRPDRQPGRPARRLERREVAELAGQEDVVPAADRADRHRDGRHPVPVIDPGPARGTGVAGQDVLDVGRPAAGGGDVRLAERQGAQRALRPADLGALAEDRQRALLLREHDAPAERRLQREGVSAQEIQRQRRLGHVRDHRRDLGRQAVGHGPLGVPQVAVAVQHDRPAGPGLLHQPFQGGQAVLALTPHRVEHAAGPERAPAALQQHLEAPLGQRPGVHRAFHAAPPVRRADQHGGQRAPGVPRVPPVGQQAGRRRASGRGCPGRRSGSG